MGIGDECRGKLLDDLTDTRVAGRFPSLLCGNCDNLAMNGGCRAWRSLQGQSFDQPYRLIWEVTGLAFVRAARIGQSSQALLPIVFHPTLHRAGWQIMVSSNLGLGNALFQGRANDRKTFKSLRSLSL